MRLKHLPAALLAFGFLLFSVDTSAQLTDKVYEPFIGTPQLTQYGDQLQLPILRLNSGDKMELNYDDFEGRYKNYYYTYQLCDYNWHPVDITPFDYIKGFTQNRIITYRYSSIAYTKYTHYSAVLPEQNSTPIKSGNYILKVFLDGDTSKLAFTKRFLVIDSKASVSGQVVQPLGGKFRENQKIRFTVAITPDLNAFSPAQQVKVVILQNNRWDNAQRDIAPMFVRGDILDYSSDNIGQFPGGKEFRWLDLRSLRIYSDRVDHADYGKTFTNIYVMPDVDRSPQRYVYYGDYDGMYNIVTYERINQYWQGDYATVKFSFSPPDHLPYVGKEMYVAGKFTDYEISDKYKMRFNESTGNYEGSVFMKQGYYSYMYLLKDKDGTVDQSNPVDGNYWETENNYTILVYYKGFTDRSDQIIGFLQINSLNNRPTIILN